MLKPLMIATLLLGSTCLLAQNEINSKPSLIHGFELSGRAIPFGCPEASLRFSVILNPSPSNFFSVGVDLDSYLLKYATPSLRLGYLKHLKQLNEKLILNFVLDTRHRVKKDKEYVRYYHLETTVPQYNYARFQPNIPRKDTEYQVDVDPGIGLIWNINNDLSLNSSVGPTITYAYHRTEYRDNPDYNYGWSYFELHFYTKSGLVYKI